MLYMIWYSEVRFFSFFFYILFIGLVWWKLFLFCVMLLLKIWVSWFCCLLLVVIRFVILMLGWSFLLMFCCWMLSWLLCWVVWWWCMIVSFIFGCVWKWCGCGYVCWKICWCWVFVLVCSWWWWFCMYVFIWVVVVRRLVGLVCGWVSIWLRFCGCRSWWNSRFWCCIGMVIFLICCWGCVIWCCWCCILIRFLFGGDMGWCCSFILRWICVWLNIGWWVMFMRLFIFVILVWLFCVLMFSVMVVSLSGWYGVFGKVGWRVCLFIFW